MSSQIRSVSTTHKQMAGSSANRAEENALRACRHGPRRAGRV